MTEPAHISLFDEMDVAGDALRKDDPNLHDALGDELQRLFRKIRERSLSLSPACTSSRTSFEQVFTIACTENMHPRP